MFVVRLQSTGEFLGMAGLHHIGDPEPEIGIWIKEAAHGFGYGRDAVATAIAWASSELGATGFIYPVVKENWPSRHLAESLGGTLVGTRTLTKASGVVLDEVDLSNSAALMFLPRHGLVRAEQQACRRTRLRYCSPFRTRRTFRIWLTSVSDSDLNSGWTSENDTCEARSCPSRCIRSRVEAHRLGWKESTGSVSPSPRGWNPIIIGLSLP